ncbi:hypothetical protein K493DRAFT_392092 [Basidiobolus meristosporus CBS 931.73]|uniref:Uncharacterized protein n=1 Tax=Basidiobolus meristosporus CBS 931.73 TaxID=1314790 RepID=A0A1Y1WWA6_9FUNG|nr:hypothetical protein K493DRAFT_392092 [Basidiobolus meristosporus CBS 931.73]|eukprot:ORX77837.1 hypothetical protein K493DRAFT_392092 [Basidiobolus meristosporus CBS 931.73]
MPNISSSSSLLSQHPDLDHIYKFNKAVDKRKIFIYSESDHQDIYSLSKESTRLFKHKVVLRAQPSGTEVYTAKTRHSLGYIKITSNSLGLRLNLTYPKGDFGVYTFNLDAIDYLWDYQEGQFLCCYTAIEKNLIALFEWPKTDDEIGFLAVAESCTKSQQLLSFLLFSAILIKYPQLYKKRKGLV